MNENKKYLVAGVLVFVVVLSSGCIDIEIKDSRVLPKSIGN